MAAVNESELDSQMRARGVPMDQRKRILAAAKLGVPNPLAQLGLAPASSTMPFPIARSSSRSRSPQRGLLSVPAAEPVQALPVDQSRRANALRVLRASEDDDQDLDGFLAGGRKATAAMAKQKAAELARREQAAREQASRERQNQAEREALATLERQRLEKEKEAERKRRQEEREREEEERRREARRRTRREEKMRKREEKKRQRAAEAPEEDSEEDDSEEERREERDKRKHDLPQKGFFSQAYKGNQEAKRIWSEPIKGQVSNNYKGFSDADLDRRFAAQSTSNANQKLMTEEEVLAILRKGKASRA